MDILHVGCTWFQSKPEKKWCVLLPPPTAGLVYSAKLADYVDGRAGYAPSKVPTYM